MPADNIGPAIGPKIWPKSTGPICARAGDDRPSVSARLAAPQIVTVRQRRARDKRVAQGDCPIPPRRPKIEIMARRLSLVRWGRKYGGGLPVCRRLAGLPELASPAYRRLPATYRARPAGFWTLAGRRPFIAQNNLRRAPR